LYPSKYPSRGIISSEPQNPRLQASGDTFSQNLPVLRSDTYAALAVDLKDSDIAVGPVKLCGKFFGPTRTVSYRAEEKPLSLDLIFLAHILLDISS
jgi:hypothetical protein